MDVFLMSIYCLGLPVGNVPLGQEPATRNGLERTVSLPVSSTESSKVPVGGFEVGPHFAPQMRPQASPDTGKHQHPII